MKSFNISLPTSWAELSDKQLLLIFELFARDLSAAEVKTLCLMNWNSCYKREQSQTRLNFVERCKNRLKGSRLKLLCQLPDKRFLIKRGKVFDKPNEQRKACFISAMARKLRPKVKGEPEVPLSASQGRRTFHLSGAEPGLPRIWSVAGLRHRQRNSPWQP